MLLSGIPVPGELMDLGDATESSANPGGSQNGSQARSRRDVLQRRKKISSRKVFPNDDSVVKILFLNIRNFSNRWTKRQGWDIVMNQLAVIFPDRLRPEVIDSLGLFAPSVYTVPLQPR